MDAIGFLRADASATSAVLLALCFGILVRSAAGVLVEWLVARFTRAWRG